MTMHLFGTVLTPQAIASNNRGESEGTISTLQKVIRDGDIYSTVSSEAIRYAIREGWQIDDTLKLCRKVSHHGSTWDETGRDFQTPEEYIDCDVLGYMHAKKETVSRRGILEISRAVSTSPWPGTITAHFASPRSNPSINSDDPIPYQAEVHDTRYQFTFAMTPNSLLKDKYSRTEKTLLAIQDLRRVAGNHARFLFDFAPEAIVLRWTADPAPRIMFCFEQDEQGRLSLTKLARRLQGGDLKPSEIVIGTSIEGIAGLDEIRELKREGDDDKVTVETGVKAAVTAVLEKVKKSVTD